MDKSASYMPFFAAFGAVAALSLMDAVMKGASLAAGVYTATLLRALIGAAIIAPIWAIRDFRVPSRAVMALHLERGLVSAVMALSFFYALTKLPIAEAIAISFVAPLLALYLARILLGETIPPRAILASLLGFVGMLVIVGGRIGQGEFDDQIALGLAALLFSALLYAYNFIIIRKQSQVAGPLEVATFHSGVGGIILVIFAPWGWVTPDIATWGAISIGALLTVIAAMALAWAYARAEAQALVPIEYSGFLWASLFGWLFFREEVTLVTIAGTALIVAGCWLATRGGAQAAKAPDDADGELAGKLSQSTRKNPPAP
ncbi:DMT family transporter [Erythrobacter sp.]|jgi:S-adenosylmethionine uptake transporter|uniref:DMT family transporter n=1 Tax=Erythrobacter sp. TaxID=1042 RepID=UPI002EB48B2E|nr:DMT family transporter [Erythrobacter sp.]